MSTEQVVAEAIDRSIARDCIAHIDEIDAKQAGTTLDAVCDALFSECEDEVETDTVREFWGKDVDGNEWRVHVELS